MNEIEVALAVSARNWPDRIHRFLADHGGARVRAQILSAEDALAENYDILIIDDICSFLTPRLVDQVRRRRGMILGVFDPNDSPDGKERLLECGVDLVIEADADGDEFVVALRTLALVPGPTTSPPSIPEDPPPASSGQLIVIGGPPGGCGATELSIAWSQRLSRSHPTVLVDVDEVAPSLAQRLGLQLLPNLRTALDALVHRHGALDQSIINVGSTGTIVGLSGDRDWMEVRPSQVVDLLSELRRNHRKVVANTSGHLEQVGFADGGRFGITRQVVAAADHLVVVGLPSPVGIGRLMTWLAQTKVLNHGATREVVINHRPTSRFRREEIIEEITRAFPEIPVGFLPVDPQVSSAAWAGHVVSVGPYYRAVSKLVDRSRSR